MLNMGKQDLKKWAQFKFNQPREEVLARTNFDTATLWQW